MIERLEVFETDSLDPYRNIAVEQRLMETVPKGCCRLYLWRNERTVVIGRNQNAWRECRVEKLERDGGHLARRLSGGGAVFHDLGNLNFTFASPSDEHDVARQTRIVLAACRAVGVPVEVSGRNDLVLWGRKVSGSAYFRHAGRSLHHGTLLVDVDPDALAAYLSPSAAKLEAKGVDSVRSRVRCLRDAAPAVTVGALSQALVSAFEEEFGLSTAVVTPEVTCGPKVDELAEHFSSPAWVLGKHRPFTWAFEHRFDWGELRLELLVVEGVIACATAYSDAMDWEVAPQLETALTGARFETSHLAARAASCAFACAADVASALAAHDL